MKKWTVVVLLLSACATHGQTDVQYRVAYPAAGGSVVLVRIDLLSPRPASL